MPIVLYTLGLNITKNHAFRKVLNSSDAMQSLTSAQRGALFGHSARVNEEHYTIVKDDKLINSAKKAFGMVENKEKKEREEDDSYLLTPNELHKSIQFTKRKPLKASSLQRL